MLDALTVARHVVQLLRPLVEKIARRDKDLARQLRRSGSSVPSNTGEGRMRNGGDRLHSYRVAHGSAAEVIEQLHIAVAWGYIKDSEAAETLAELDRVCAMLWKLTH